MTCGRGEHAKQEAYKALDDLLDAVGNLPLKFIRERPPLDKAVEQGHKVIDEGVKEDRYTPDRIGGN